MAGDGRIGRPPGRQRYSVLLLFLAEVLVAAGAMTLRAVYLRVFLETDELALFGLSTAGSPACLHSMMRSAAVSDGTLPSP